MLDEWWRSLATRLRRARTDAAALESEGSAFDRLPGELGLIAEAFYLECCRQARAQVQAELTSERATLSARSQDMEVRGHILALREKELSRLARRREQRVEDLERELREQTTYARKIQHTKDRLERKVHELEEQQRTLLAQKKAKSSVTPRPKMTAKRKSAVSSKRKTHLAKASSHKKRRRQAGVKTAPIRRKRASKR
jgi:chromosome segregation ATPase